MSGGTAPTQLKTATLDGHSIGYSSETEFRAQVASPRGKYQTRYSIRGNLGQAVLYYNGINLGYGWRAHSQLARVILGMLALGGLWLLLALAAAIIQ